MQLGSTIYRFKVKVRTELIFHDACTTKPSFRNHVDVQPARLQHTQDNWEGTLLDRYCYETPDTLSSSFQH